MEKRNYILVTEYCQQTNIEDKFLKDLEEYGLIKIRRKSSDIYIDEEEISEIERMFRLHKELKINLEGIDALNHMIRKMQHLEYELNQMRARLGIYE